ncbi:MAG: cytochrome-c peroxidase [Desulfomonilaceae bacterium]
MLTLLGIVLLIHIIVPSNAQPEDLLLVKARQFFQPLSVETATQEFPMAPELVELGRALFFDPRLSFDGTVSCSRCHQPSLYGTDALPKSVGVENRPNPRNAPTILNAALQFSLHWYGDRTSVEDQAAKSFLGPASFGNPDFASVKAKIKAVTGYEEMFAKAFPSEKDPVTQQNCGKAIGAYERTLLTPSPFDSYLRGDTKSLSAVAVAGLTEFLEVGCVSCHGGIALGGGEFRKFGILRDYWELTGSSEVDKGRFNVTNDPADLYVFKVPGLRNVSMTPPYFHDGSVATLPQAIRLMADLQIGKKLSEQQVHSMVHFLDALTGKLPAGYAVPPTLPPGGFQAR